MEIEQIGQEQIHDLLFQDKLSWQAIIYDLINTEQLDPWNVDIGLLSKKYLEKVRELEEANFFISSKVLYAASLLLRIKSDILLNSDLVELDVVLFGSKEDKKYSQERIELDEDLPDLIPRTPLPRSRRVTLQELMVALGKAIKTENRRIKRTIDLKQYEREAEIVMPKNVFDLRANINEIYKKLKNIFSNRETKLAFTELIENSMKGRGGSFQEKRVAAFVSLLHLDTQQKIWIEQEGHFEEIWILMKNLYEKNKGEKIEAMIEKMEEENIKERKIEKATGFGKIIE